METSVETLRNNLPKGIIWEGLWSDDTNIGKFILSIGDEFDTYHKALDNISKGFNVALYSTMIERFEEFLGIPDTSVSMWGKDSPMYERQLDVYTKLFLMRDNSIAGLQNIAKHYSSTLTILDSTDPAEILVKLSTTLSGGTHYDHDYDHEYVGRQVNLQKIISILEYLKPVHTKLTITT